jgi:hypothetical protein
MRGMRRGDNRRSGLTGRRLLGLLLVPVLGGCGGAAGPRTATTPPDSLAAKTSGGLSYTLRITTKDGQQCTAATYRAALPDGRPLLQGMNSCGPPARPGHPVLIQASSSRESLVVDVPGRTCGTVRAGRTHATLRPVMTRCTAPRPLFRATILPPVSRLLIAGIPGVPVINFPRHRCRIGLCITPLA